MAYTTNQALETLNRYLGITDDEKQIIENTKGRGFVFALPNGEKATVFVYPLVHKQDNTKNYFDTRDSGAYERGVTWNYAIANGMKYFCIGVNDTVNKYNDYSFSLECNESDIEKISGTLNGSRNGPGNQIIIPNDYVPSKGVERIVNKLGIYITAVHKDNLLDYLTYYDNRPYMENAALANLDELVGDTYAITQTENDKCKAAIHEIGKDYVDSFANSKDKVFFLLPQVDNDQVSPLKRTLKDPMFDRLFLKATDMTISALSNPTKASVFYLDPSNCKFRFSGLKDFIINNIGSYVFSRAQIKRITDMTKNPTAIGSRAMLKFMTTYGANAESVLGEILLYIFMEQELDAPKIMSKIEINESNRNSVSKSDGVHLLSIDKAGQPCVWSIGHSW